MSIASAWRVLTSKRALYTALSGMALLTAACRSSQPAGKNVEATWGLDVIRAISEDPQNVVLPILKCDLDGFTEDVSEYRTWAVKRTTPNGRITATVPRAGMYYPGFVFYDGPGDERIDVFVDGAKAGTAVANTDDNRQKLFFLAQPYTFKGGEKIQLRALGSEGAYRTEDLLLLKERPQAKQPVYTITNLDARPEVDGNSAKASISWITNWPAACTLETDSGNMTESEALNNHRAVLANLQPRRAYRYRISAKARDGRTISSQWQTFQTAPPAAIAGTARLERIKLNLENESASGELPVSVGVPFPQGVLGSETALRLSDPTDLQTRVLERWRDGSLKWVLLDFLSAKPHVTLEYGSEVVRRPAATPLKIAEDQESVTVDTGKIKFSVSKRRFGFLHSVWVGGEEIITPEKTGAFYLTGPDGTVYTSLAAPKEVVIEEHGPVRAVIRISGEHASEDGRKLFGYAIRLHAWAGQPYIRVQHTFINTNGASDFSTIRSLVLRVPMAQRGKEWGLAGRSGRFDAKEPVRLVQHTDDHYEIVPGPIARGDRAPGWAEWSSGSQTVTLGLRALWQNYPKDLAVSADGFELALCPSLRTDEYDSANGTMDEHRLYYYLHNGVYKLRQGVAKTHDIWLEFGKPKASLVRQQQLPLTAAAPPEWYAASKVFGELSIPRPDPILKRYDYAFAQSFQGYLQNREKHREYGMLNFGDWWGERVINWGNSEYDTQHGFLLQFVRTGNFKYFRTAEEIEWHNRDVDAVHYHTDKTRDGGVYAHAIGHTGGYYRERPKAGAPTPAGFREGSPESHMAADHTFIEGHFDYYFLSGERRSFETGISTADRYDSFFTKNYDFNNCRQPGWHLILTMAAYNATNDSYYLNAARIIVERVLERQTAEGGWKRQLVPGHCYCTPRHQGNAGFMVGVLLTGLREYYEAAGDPRVADSIVKAAHFLINDMWIPEIHGFRYTSCPKSNTGVGYNFRLFDGIVFADQRTHDPKLRQVLVSGTEAALDSMPGGPDPLKGMEWGKAFTQQIRVTPHFIDYLVQLPSPR